MVKSTAEEELPLTQPQIVTAQMQHTAQHHYLLIEPAVAAGDACKSKDTHHCTQPCTIECTELQPRLHML
jgi:hypothetical protein